MRKLLLLIPLFVLGIGWGFYHFLHLEQYAYERALAQIMDASLTGETELAIEYQYLAELPPEIGQLTNLEYLSLRNNQLTELPPEISNLSNLWRLDLDGNRLSTLPSEIGNLSNLWRLDLDNNQLQSLPPEIGNLSSLERLDLDNNQLSELPPEIGHLSNLEVLEVGNNQLSSLPPEIGRLTNLRGLYFHGNSPTLALPALHQFENYQASDDTSMSVMEIDDFQTVNDAPSTYLEYYWQHRNEARFRWQLFMILAGIVSGIVSVWGIRYIMNQRHTPQDKMKKKRDAA